VILRIVDRAMDRSTYDALRERLDIDRRHPLGLHLHGAAEVDGKMQVAQIWESDWYARKFDEEILAPALAELGVEGEANVAVFDLEHLVTP
jgi:hypothetical protein